MTTVSRRTFLTLAGALPFAARALAQGRRVPVGIELYSVRTELMKDLKGTVTAVAKMGYEVVEFYSPYLQWTPETAKDMRKLLDDLGVRCHSTHNGSNAFTPDGLQKAIELNRLIGSTAIIMASPGKVTGVEGWKGLAGRLTETAEKLRPLGMVTGFHNHQLEWRAVEGSSGQRPMDILASGTPKDVVLQLDAGTCVEAGADPVAWIQANPGRIRSIHLKDWSASRGYAVAFGEGDVPWKALLDAAESVGGIEYYLIEQEESAEGQQFAMAQRCLANYRKLRGLS
ncbi:MAG TPA: sugar phosphate isomerase/epimerase [Vicinamibacterales bacterium]|nr:sugar phosphate isomerase/epimerase [Vicinamibacterales bacterium]